MVMIRRMPFTLSHSLTDPAWAIRSVKDSG